MLRRSRQRQTRRDRVVSSSSRIERNWFGEELYLAGYVLIERVAFSALGSEKERMAFVQEFWRTRDPKRHYARLAYANKTFATRDSIGSQTDRGILYMKFGEPDEIESYPAGISRRGAPAEEWGYSSINGGGSLGLLFRDHLRTGQYEVSSDRFTRGSCLT